MDGQKYETKVEGDSYFNGYGEKIGRNIQVEIQGYVEIYIS